MDILDSAIFNCVGDIVIEKSPIKGLSDGDIVIEKSPIKGLSDGDIYIVSDCNEKLAKAVSLSKDNFMKLTVNSPLFNSYEVKAINDLSTFSKSDNLLNAINDLSTLSKSDNLLNAVNDFANVIIPLSTPNVLHKQYLVNRVKYDEVDMYLPSMLLKAEKITKAAIEEALMNLAKFDPTACNRILESILADVLVPTENQSKHDDSDGSSGGFFGGIFGNLLSSVFEPPVMGAVCACDSYFSSDSFADNNVIDVIDYQHEREIFKRFVSNCEVLRKAERKTKFSDTFINDLVNAKYEVNYVFNSIWGANKNMNSLRKIIINQSDKKLLESYDNFLNKDKMALDSKITMLIEKSKDGIDKNRKNDGFYRVYAFDGINKYQVHFKRKPSCILYMMYLLDKHKRGEDVDFLRISKNKKLFCDLYSQVYHNSGADIYDGLESKITKGEPKQTRLPDCYLDIQDSLKAVIDDIGEDVPPFVVPNRDSHISVRQEKICIPTELNLLEIKY